MLGAVTFIAAAAVAYVLMRAAWIVGGWFGVIAVVVPVAASAAWRRSVAAGGAVGAALSAFALAA